MRIGASAFVLIRSAVLLAVAIFGWAGCGDGGLKRTSGTADSGKGGTSAALGGTAGDASGPSGSGGSVIGGGTVGTGSVAPNGGNPGDGGSPGIGGAAGSGGRQNTGSVHGTGGIPGSGGNLGIGGQTILNKYVVSPDGLIVTDLRSLIQWQRDGSGVRAGCSGKGGLYCTWDEAKAYCAGLDLDGAGWSLPSDGSLNYLVDTTRVSPPAINLDAFPNTPSEAFWSSDLFSTPTNALVVNFTYGLGGIDSTVSGTNRVRCVRLPPTTPSTGGAPGTGGGSAGGGTTGTSASSAQLVASPDGLTVTDTSTGLVWQRDGFGHHPGCSGNDWGDPFSGDMTCTWPEAQAYCAGLGLDGVGWRLPTRAELKGLIDANAAKTPSVLTTPAKVRVPYFWTADTLSPGFACTIDYLTGSAFDFSQHECYWVRCVR